MLAAILCLSPGISGRAAEEEQGLRENSWRYQDGEPIELQEEPSGMIQCMEDSKVWGIDVSEHQGEIDWERVKAAGVGFVIIRCGYGEDYEFQDDLYWERNVAECERLDIPYGVYLYSYAEDPASAYSEAQHVLRLIKGHHLSFPVYFDMEEKKLLQADRAATASVFCNTLIGAGYRVGVYSNLDWWENHLTDPCFDQWERWVAQWNVTCDYKGDYGIWQHTSRGHIDGIDGWVDMDYLIRDDIGNGNPDMTSAFRDVVRGAWYQPYIQKMVELELMKGLKPFRFGVGDAVCRAQFVTVLYRVAGSPPVEEYLETFPDIPQDAFYTIPVIWGYYSQGNVIHGYENGMFGPGDPVTREQIALMLYRYVGCPGEGTLSDSLLERFSDADKITENAKDAVKWAVSAGLLEGDQGRLKPQDKTLREECAALITRFVRWADLAE